MAAEQYASSAATPNEIADAAQSKCGMQFHVYERSVEDYFASVASNRGAAMGRERGNVHAQETKRKLKGRVVQLVIKTRMGKKSGS